MISAKKAKRKIKSKVEKKVKKHLKEIKKEVKGVSKSEDAMVNYSFYDDTPKEVIKGVKKRLKKKGYDVEKNKFNGHVILCIEW